MKLQDTKAVRHLEPHQAQEFGMQRQLIMPQRHRTTHQLKRSRQDAIAGMKRQRQSVKRPVTTPGGWRRRELTEELVITSSTRLQVHQSVDLDGTKHRLQLHHQ